MRDLDIVETTSFTTDVKIQRREAPSPTFILFYWASDGFVGLLLNRFM